MKKVLIGLSLLAISFSSMAQKRVEVGIKAGMNTTRMKLTDVGYTDVSSESRNGFLVGAYGRIKLFGNVSFQPEIYYSKKSAKYTENFNNGFNNNISTNVDLQTWDIPLLAHVTVLDLKAVRLYAVAGPVVSYNAKSDTKRSSENFVGGDIITDPLLSGEPDYKKSNWTLNAGVGLQVWRFTGDVRYEWGLSNLTEHEAIGHKTNIMTFALGYRLFGI